MYSLLKFIKIYPKLDLLSFQERSQKTKVISKFQKAPRHHLSSTNSSTALLFLKYFFEKLYQSFFFEKRILQSVDSQLNLLINLISCLFFFFTVVTLKSDLFQTNILFICVHF